jgi:hypothetical protein
VQKRDVYSKKVKRTKVMRRIIGGMFIVDCMLVALLSFSMTTPHRWGMKQYQYVSSQDLMDNIQIESSEEFLIDETSNHIMYAAEIGNNVDATGTIDDDVDYDYGHGKNDDDDGADDNNESEYDDSYGYDNDQDDVTSLCMYTC